jgi:hypothetical protein
MTSFTTNGNVSRDLNSKSSSKGFSQGKMSTPGMPMGHIMPQVSGISTGGGGIKVSSILGGTHQRNIAGKVQTTIGQVSPGFQHDPLSNSFDHSKVSEIS